VWDPDTICGMNQILRVFTYKFLNIAAYKLKIDHPSHNYSPVVMHRLGLNTLAEDY